jgi:hypothetical protein
MVESFSFEVETFSFILRPSKNFISRRDFLGFFKNRNKNKQSKGVFLFFRVFSSKDEKKKSPQNNGNN